MRHFIEVCYKGTNYGGFQIQNNSPTIQSELEKALFTLFRTRFALTGSSRTDAGVHALQNYFHFDSTAEIHNSALYNLNALLPNDIAVRSIIRVPDQAHCRFDATSREYNYYIYNRKNPFISEGAWYYPYQLDATLLQEASDIILTNNDFSLFCKKNSQTHSNRCNIMHSFWKENEDNLVYCVKANRFLRGMVKALVATMLKIGRGRLSLEQLKQIFIRHDGSGVDFSAPSHGLFLSRVHFPSSLGITYNP